MIRLVDVPRRSIESDQEAAEGHRQAPMLSGLPLLCAMKVEGTQSPKKNSTRSLAKRHLCVSTPVNQDDLRNCTLLSIGP